MKRKRIILVTGASSGIGLDTCLDLASRDWLVWAGVRRPESHDQVHRRAVEAGVADAIRTVDLDVTRLKQIQEAVDLLISKEGRAPDALLANAGIGALGFVEDLDLQTWRRIIDTDFLGAVIVIREVLPAMRRGGGGHVLIVSSNAANLPHPAFSPYAAAKWALEGLAESLALEVAPFGISVTLLQPGATRTAMADRIVHDLPDNSAYLPLMDCINVGFGHLGNGAIGTEAVTRTIRRLLDRERPPLRARIGKDAKLAAVGRHIIPGDVRLALARRFYHLPGWGKLAGVGSVPADSSVRPTSAEQGERSHS